MANRWDPQTFMAHEDVEIEMSVPYRRARRQRNFSLQVLDGRNNTQVALTGVFCSLPHLRRVTAFHSMQAEFYRGDVRHRTVDQTPFVTLRMPREHEGAAAVARYRPLDAASPAARSDSQPVDAMADEILIRALNNDRRWRASVLRARRTCYPR